MIKPLRFGILCSKTIIKTWQWCIRQWMYYEWTTYYSIIKYKAGNESYCFSYGRGFATRIISSCAKSPTLHAKLSYTPQTTYSY